MATDRAPSPAVLESRVEELERELRVQQALVRIAEAAAAADDLPGFYAEVHETLRGLTNAENCYIALYDEQRGAINFPYYVDTVDPDIPDPRAWTPFGDRDARGVTGYVLRTGTTAHFTQGEFDDLI